MASDSGSYTYVGRGPCGHVRGLVIDNPECKGEVGKTLSAWVRDGDTIERVPTEEARKMELCHCPTEAPKKKAVARA